MVQQQLIEYISSQVKLGVTKDALKSSLITAGWAQADVDDTMKKFETDQAVAASSVISSPAKPAAMGGAMAVGPQTIKVSDLVSATDASGSFSGMGQKKEMGAGMAMNMKK